MTPISFLRHHFRSFIVFLLFIFALPAFGAKGDMESYKQSKSLARSVGIQSARTWKIYVAAEKGDVESQYILAVKYHKGDGIEQNRRRAVDWYRRAAKRGHLEASYNLAHMYLTGTGVKQDISAALDWYRRAALFCLERLTADLKNKVLFETANISFLK